MLALHNVVRIVQVIFRVYASGGEFYTEGAAINEPGRYIFRKSFGDEKSRHTGHIFFFDRAVLMHLYEDEYGFSRKLGKGRLTMCRRCVHTGSRSWLSVPPSKEDS